MIIETVILYDISGISTTLHGKFCINPVAIILEQKKLHLASLHRRRRPSTVFRGRLSLFGSTSFL
jgi:hypothetical protein